MVYIVFGLKSLQILSKEYLVITTSVWSGSWITREIGNRRTLLLVSMGIKQKSMTLLTLHVVTVVCILQGNLSIVESLRNKFPYNFMYCCVLISGLYLQ